MMRLVALLPLLLLTEAHSSLRGLGRQSSRGRVPSPFFNSTESAPPIVTRAPRDRFFKFNTDSSKPGKKPKGDASPGSGSDSPDLKVDRAPGNVDIPKMELFPLQTEIEEPGPSTSGGFGDNQDNPNVEGESTPGTEVDLGPGTVEISQQELPSMETEIAEQAPHPSGSTGDVQDSPNVDGDLPPDLPPPDELIEIPQQELPPMETEIAGQAPLPSGSTGDIQDSPNVDGDLPQDLTPPEDELIEIPQQELPPIETEIAGQVPLPSGSTGDIQDSPNVDGDLPQDLPPPEDELMSFTPPAGDLSDTPGIDGGPEIPAMELIPESILGSDTLNGDLPPPDDGFLSFAPPPGDGQDAPGNDGGSGISNMEPIPSVGGAPDAPIVIPFGEEAESYILHDTASICAPTLHDAQEICANLPICKYPKHGKSIGTQIVLGQGNCVRRCDAPLGESHCAPHEACFNFVMGCNCPRLTNDGGKCQPY